MEVVMDKISDRWAKVILWAGSYINAILFAIVGGYYWLKTDREELKKECKKVLWVTLIFLALEMTIGLISSFITLCNADGYTFISVVSSIVVIAKICTYTLFGLFALFGVKITLFEQRNKENKENNTKPAEEKVEVEIVEPNKED